ncbi:MAG: CotH kinase family protein [Flavobacteriales bacterium]|nr:CotH kinase family protein [Flavobacteriales bacterium]
MSSPQRADLAGLLLAVLASGMLAAWAGRSERVVTERGDGPVPVITPPTAHLKEGDTIRIQGTGGRALWLAEGPDAPLRDMRSTRLSLVPHPDRRRADRMLATPTAVQWNRPLPGLPLAHVVRVAEEDDLGRRGPVRLRTTVFADHGVLPVVSLVMPEGALFDPDTGIYVPGNAMLAPHRPQLALYKEDGRWWKYPGNYSGRGKAWERRALVQFIGADGGEIHQGPVGVRIHGNMTRGFPLRALRLVFAGPLRAPLFGDGEPAGAMALVLRPGGNDGIKALMRDAVVNELCAGEDFEVSRASTAVLYINGCYWGIHHLRQRVDEKEIARRHGLKAKKVRMVEVELGVIHGDPEEVARFKALVETAKGPSRSAGALYKALNELMDVESFLAYMAACIITGQRDWPLRNVRAWRHAGGPGMGRADGRWRFILNDMDLSMGATAPANAPLFHQLDQRAFALPALWTGAMRDPFIRERFQWHVERLLEGPLSKENMLAMVDHFAGRMAPEMRWHTARWRKPASVETWHTHVDELRTFVKARERAVRDGMRGYAGSNG